MEFAVFVVEAKGFSELVDDYKAKMTDKRARLSGFSLAYETSSKPGGDRIIAFNVGSGIGAETVLRAVAELALIGADLALDTHARPRRTIYRRSSLADSVGSPERVFTVAQVKFSRLPKGRCRVTVSVASGGSVSTDKELGIIDDVTDPIRANAKSVETIYRSAWIYDDDEKVRNKAITSIDQIERGLALEPLTKLLRHDRSDAIRERAAMSLANMGTAEAADTVRNALSNYLHGDRSRHGIAAACAQALGTMRDRKSLENLNELLEVFEKKQLSAQALTVKQAIYRIRHGKDMKETFCIVCNQPVQEADELLQCPYCKGVAHREQLLEWLHVKDHCPKCEKHMDEDSLKRTRLADLSLKTRVQRRAKR